MWFRAVEQRKFLAVAVWLGERQHLWAEWRAIAEARDGDGLSEHLASLLGPNDMFEEFVAALVFIEREHEPEITISAGLASRRFDILRHRFETLSLRDSFMDWTDNEDGLETAKALALIGLLEERGALANVIDAIAEAPRLYPKDPAKWPSRAKH